MDVEESEWVNRATKNVDRYLHRGGKCEGDKPQVLGGTDLLNTIGMAMGLPMLDPGKWSEQEQQKAFKNELVYFTGVARDTIDFIAAQIRACCEGDSENFVTVLPIELFYKGKLYELPLFRVHRYKNTDRFYVDNIGRIYKSSEDWLQTNKLPPCQMAYPHNLQLALREGCDHSHIDICDTPFSQKEHEVAKKLDTFWAVAGIGSGVGLTLASGGLALPFVVTGLASAVWGTARCAERLADKSEHGESINPFTDPESRAYWLGIAANLANFTAMGASMQLTSLAMKGHNISTAFRVFVDVANGTNLGISSYAIMESTNYMCSHIDELSHSDILLHVASLAFWTKGVFNYKTSGAIIKDAQNVAFNHINKELAPGPAEKLTEFRKQFNNDGRLLSEFHRAAKARISAAQFSQIIVDANARGGVRVDGAGNLVLPGGQKYSFAFLAKLPQDVRQTYFDLVTNLSPDKSQTFENFRNTVNDDMNLITGLNRVAAHYNINAREATEGVINFWQRIAQSNTPKGMEVKMSDGQIVLGSGPPIQINQLPKLTSPMVRFIGEHLSRMDVAVSNQWSSSISVLVTLQNNGLFTQCPVTSITTTGRAVLSLNNHLQISIYKLQAISADECRIIFEMIGKLPSAVSSTKLPKDVVKLCVQKHRLRLQCHRAESLSWMQNNVEDKAALRRLVGADLLSHELDRLFMFRSTVDTYKASSYMGQMMDFVSERNPKNVSEMVAYCEFVVKCVETEKLMVEKKLRDGTVTLPLNVKKSEWTRQHARETVFRNTAAMQLKFDELSDIVVKNDMVGGEWVGRGLSDSELVEKVRKTDVKFGSRVSAAYHVYKHPTEPLGEYVARANGALRSADRHMVILTQEGSSRTVRFEGEGGTCIVLETEGRVLLCTFMPSHK